MWKKDFILLKKSTIEYKKCKYLLNNIFITILYLFGSLLYFYSLSTINGPKMKCFSRIGLSCFYYLGKLIFFSALMTNFSLYLIIFKNHSKIHLFSICFLYAFLFYYDHNTGLVKHGIYNIFIFLISLVAIFFLLIFIHYLIFLYKKNVIFLILFLIPIFLFYWIFNFYKKYNFSCSDWEKGLNNTKIDNNDNYPCIINIPPPHSCYLNSIGPYMDLSNFYRPTCLNKKLLESNKRSLLNNFKKLKYASESIMNNFGLPITTNKKYDSNLYGTILFRKGKRNFLKDINNNIILMDLYYKNKSKYYPKEDRPEVELLIGNNTEKDRISINFFMIIILYLFLIYFELTFNNWL